jgi:hypothetical protein
MPAGNKCDEFKETDDSYNVLLFYGIGMVTAFKTGCPSDE